MNEDHLQQIFENYINRFEEFNSEDRKKPSEYYKWEITISFKKIMDRALNGKAEDFASELDEIKRATSDFIDNKNKWPLAGMRRVAEKKGGAIQELFRALYAEDSDNLRERQNKIRKFLEQIHQLEEQEGLSNQFRNDFHSVTTYLFLYDSDRNYVYKPTHAQAFQDCIDFYNDFGEGDNVNLEVYYQMCDDLVEAIKNNLAIQETDKLRAKKFKGEAHPDTKKHILAYDIIYCASQYDLFRGITFVHRTTKERKVLFEKQEKAKALLVELKKAQEEKKKLDEAREAVDEAFCTGKNISYKNFGKNAPIQNGTIAKRNNNIVVINLEGENNKTVVLPDAVVNGYIWPQDEQEAAGLASSIELLKNRSMIKTNLETAEREFAPYNDYI